MAWETRGKNKYFYQKERIGDKVKSTYQGKGEVIELISECEESRRREKLREKEILKLQRLKAEVIDNQLDEISEINKSLVDALFLLNGYYQHKRQWRKKRNGDRSR